ncbi:hypothetical protein, partial [Bordetella muralis]|uniref:hypothetical protein n=1 Tax=Bordetella muralis TaxID=1649130 RepID=UPI0039F05B95
LARRGGWANSLRYAALKHAQPTSPRLAKQVRQALRASAPFTRRAPARGGYERIMPITDLRR